MKKIAKPLCFITGVFALMSSGAWAVDHVVKGKGVAFDPVVVFAQVGDTIAFRNMAAHFVASIKVPESAEKMTSAMGEDYDYPLGKAGVYFYKCPPHWGARMGGLIVVGDTSGLDDTLAAYREEISDKTGKSFLNKIRKNIEKGKINVP